MTIFSGDIFNKDAWQLLLPTLVLGLCLAWYIRTFWMPVASNLPPGPPRIPSPFHIFLTLSMIKRGLEPLLDIGRKYGDLVYIHLGPRRTVLISSYEMVKAILIDQADCTSDREQIPVFNTVLQYNKGAGVIFSNGKEWRENRRFTLKSLRSMGLGKRSLESQINEEARCLCAEFASHRQSAFIPDVIMRNAISNIICSISFGHRYAYDDAKFRSAIGDVQTLASEDFGIILNLPLIFYKKMINVIENILGHIKGEIAFHAKNFDANDQRDMIDMFLAEVETAKAGGGTPLASPELFSSTLFDLFIAGTDTTSTALLWGLIILADSMEIQDQLAAEINAVIGSERQPVYQDRENMPYTRAFTLELLRFLPVAAVGVPHVATTDLKVRGYQIPKGTELIMNMMAIHRDPNIWKEPNVFKPERFLTEDRKTVLKRPELIPFEAGRRVCLGEQLAKMELFLFLTNVLQRFSIHFPSGDRPNYDYGNRVQIIGPKPYNIIMKER